MRTNLAFFLSVFLKICYLFLAVLGLHCCAGFSLVAASGGYSPAAVSRLLIAVVFLLRRAQALEQVDFRSCIMWAQVVVVPGL